MSFSRLKLPLLASALAVAGAAHAATALVSEGFDNDTSTLAGKGWVIKNLSTPGGSTSWFEPGAGAVIPAYSGSSYMAATYQSSGDFGTVDNWLISPTFSTANAGFVTLYLTGANEADLGFVDTLKFGFSGGGTTTTDFSMGTLVTAPEGWTAYTFAFAAAGAGSVGRFAVEYTGAWDTLDYVGIDSLSVNAVPEPATWAMFALGAAAALARRRRSAR